MFATAISSLATSCVIAVALLLPALVFGLNTNLTSLLDGFQNNARIILFLNNDVSETQGMQVSDNLLTDLSIIATEYISSSAALTDFGAAAGISDILSSMENNPLPAGIVITPSTTDPTAVQILGDRLATLAEVELVQIDSLWLQRLAAISGLVSTIGQVLVLVVLLALFFIVGNTIRLAIDARRDEIRIVKLVGGTDSYALRPFLYLGLYYGLAGGLLAALLQLVVFNRFNVSLQGVILLYDGQYELRGLGIVGALGLIFSGGLVAWFAALVSGRRCIGQIDKIP